MNEIKINERLALMDFTTRLGKIFFNLSIVLLIVVIAAFSTAMIGVLILLFGFILIILSFGTIFTLVDNYFDKLTNVSGITLEISTSILQYWDILIISSILLAALSIVLLAIDKRQKHIARIVIASIIVGIAVIVAIAFLSGVIK